MKTLLITILIFLLSSPAFAYRGQGEDVLRCNPTNGKWTYEDSESVLKPNLTNGKWTYEDSDSTLQPNPTDGTWGYVR